MMSPRPTICCSSSKLFVLVAPGLRHTPRASAYSCAAVTSCRERTTRASGVTDEVDCQCGTADAKMIRQSSCANRVGAHPFRKKQQSERSELTWSSFDRLDSLFPLYSERSIVNKTKA